MNASRGLLAVKFKSLLDQETANLLRESLEPIAKRLNSEVLVHDGYSDVVYQPPLDALVQALNSYAAAVRELAASNMALVESLTRQDEEEVDPHIPQGMGRKR